MNMPIERARNVEATLKRVASLEGIDYADKGAMLKAFPSYVVGGILKNAYLALMDDRHD